VLKTLAFLLVCAALFGTGGWPLAVLGLSIALLQWLAEEGKRITREKAERAALKAITESEMVITAMSAEAESPTPIALDKLTPETMAEWRATIRPAFGRLFVMMLPEEVDQFIAAIPAARLPIGFRFEPVVRDLVASLEPMDECARLTVQTVAVEERRRLEASGILERQSPRDLA